MTLESLRAICLALPGATEDIKWGADLVFSVGGKMFCAVNADPPHQLGFKCSEETFAELVERPGIRPAPYLARAMWVQEEALGEALDRRELEQLLRAAYEIVKAKLPKSRQKALAGAAVTRGRRPKRRAARKRR
jgi:predicted DNA-binding protein (MmcQ/YjbR family)